MRMNMLAPVATPRSLHPTLAWIDTRKAVLQAPMPTPMTSDPAAGQATPLEGCNCVSIAAPITRATPPSAAARR